MRNALKLSAPSAPFPVDVFLARVEARAILVREFYLDLPDAVDGLQSAAIASGLVTELGQDAVQAMMVEAFAAADVFLARCEARAILSQRRSAFAKLGQEMLAETLSKPPASATNNRVPGDFSSERAAESTVDALVLSLRERGEAALADPRCRQRLADLSTVQVRQVIARLMRLRSRYPAVTDEVLLRLGKQL